MRKVILEATSISKIFLRTGGYSTLRDKFRVSKEGKLWALRDINLKIFAGEILGISGSNGSGKSTLLRVLGKVTSPTHGRIRSSGRVGSIIEVVGGFHPDLSGRENIHLLGLMAGFRSKEVRNHFSEIVEFAGVGDLLDEPVKRFSSGMLLRLSFSTLACLRPDILLLDEVLSVADERFRQKMVDRLLQLQSQGVAVVLVAHDRELLERLAFRLIVLDQGRVVSLNAGSAPHPVSRHRIEYNRSDDPRFHETH